MLSASRMYALGAVIAQVLVVGYASAQEGTAVLTGTVKDASTGAPLANVVVTVTSPALQGEQIVVTDGSGSYRVPNLPPGTYVMALEGDGYRAWSRGGIGLVAEATIRLNAQLLPDTLKAEEVEVIAEAPTIDIGSSSTGKSISKDFARRVPVMAPGGKGSANRSFEAVAASTPGAKADEYGVSMSGTTSPENQYAIDGLSVNSPAFGLNAAPLSTEFVAEVNVITGGYMPEYGRSTGAIVNAVTKTGSNKVQGSVWAYVSPGALDGPKTLVRSDGDSLRTDSRSLYNGDVGFDIGGPIQKDKLWYYVGFDLMRDEREMKVGVYRRLLTDPSLPPGPTNPWKTSDGFTDTALVPNSEQVRKAVMTAVQAFGKLTFGVNQDNRISLSAMVAPSFSGGDPDLAIDQDTGTAESFSGGEYGAVASKYSALVTDLLLKWNSEHDNKRLLFDTGIGWHSQSNKGMAVDGTSIGDNSGLAADPSVTYRRSRPLFVEDPTGATGGTLLGADDGHYDIQDFRPGAYPECSPIQAANPAYDPALPPDAGNAQFHVYYPCPVDVYVLGGPGSLSSVSANRYFASEVVTYFVEGAGHHTVKVGAEAEYTDYSNKWGYSGGRAFRENTGGTLFTANRGGGYLTGPDDYTLIAYTDATSHSVSTGAFMQDQWSIVDKVTLNAGFRWDSQWVYGGDKELALGLPNQISPRVGLIYDPTQEGRSKLFGNFARFYEAVPLDLADRAGTNRPSIGDQHSATDCNPRDPAQRQRGGACWSDATRIRVNEDSLTNADQHWLLLGIGKTPIDPDIRPQSSDEIVFGGDYEVVTDIRAGLVYKKRWMNAVIEDMSRDEATTYFIGNPGQGIAGDFPEAVRDYDEVTVTLEKQFRNEWLASLNYTWSHLRGNYSGLFRPETGQLDPNINSDFDLISLLDNRTGDLPGDRRHYIKLYAAKDFTVAESSVIKAGVSVVANSGGPTNAYGSHELYGSDESFLVARGLGERLPWRFEASTNLGYQHKLGGDMSVEFTVEVYNLLGLQGITSVDERYTSDDVKPNLKDLLDYRTNPDGDPLPGTPIASIAELDETVNTLNNAASAAGADPVLVKNTNFGKPDAYQRPRSFRFGLRFNY